MILSQVSAAEPRREPRQRKCSAAARSDRRPQICAKPRARQKFAERPGPTARHADSEGGLSVAPPGPTVPGAVTKFTL
jgi:hypothetical protein